MTKDETMSWVEEISVAGQPAFCLRNAVGDQVVVLQHGAQILSWMTADGVERLYCTSRLPSEPKPVRGGVPVIFPQFNQRGPDFTLPRHGFARQLPWYRVAPNVAAQAAPAPTPFPGMPGAESGAVAASAPAPAGCGLPETHVPADMTAIEAVPGLHAADLVLALGDGPETHKSWEHTFRLQLRIRLLPQQLDMQLVLDNTGTQPMRFTAALHTYLAVPELPGTTLNGLEGSTRLDTLVQPNRQEAAPGGPLILRGAIDDIYFDVPRPLRLHSGGGALRIGMSGGFVDTVVWNPGPEGAKALADMPDDDWRRMLCVEAACIGRPAEVPPGGRWLAGQQLQVL